MRFLLFIFMFVSSVTHGRSYNVLYPLSEDEVPSASSMASAKGEGLRVLSEDTPVHEIREATTEVTETTKEKEKRLLDAAGKKKGAVEEVKKLLKEGVDPNAVDKDGRTALHIATDIEVIKVLLASEKIDVNVRGNHFDRTALHEAAGKNDLEKVKALLAAGAKPNLANGAGYTALYELTDVKFRDVNFRAGKVADIRIVEALLDAGAKLDAKLYNGQTLLHRAAMLGNVELTRFYLEKGADPNAKTENGETPYDFAERSEEIKEILRTAEKASCKGTFNN